MAFNYFLKYQLGDVYRVLGEEAREFIFEYRIVADFTWSYYIGDKIVACGGFAHLWDGVYELWYNPPEVIARYPIAILKKAREQLEALLRVEGVQRIQTQIRCDLPGGKHLMNFLGFQHEGTLRRFIDNEDYAMYARIK